MSATDTHQFVNYQTISHFLGEYVELVLCEILDMHLPLTLMLVNVFVVSSHGEVEIVEAVRQELLVPFPRHGECINLHSVLFVACDEAAPYVALFIIKDVQWLKSGLWSVVTQSIDLLLGHIDTGRELLLIYFGLFLSLLNIHKAVLISHP